MIDWEDVDLAAWAGPSGFIGLILVLVLAYFACQNQQKCDQGHCPDGQRPRLMDHACLCTQEAQP